jgi:hypothetical protein
MSNRTLPLQFDRTPAMQAACHAEGIAQLLENRNPAGASKELAGQKSRACSVISRTLRAD